MGLPYFNLYPTDFEADTSHLTLEEDGAYNRLLRLVWMSPGCSLPDDDAWIMRRMRVDRDTFERVVRVVLDEFFVRKSGRVSNARLSREYASSSEAHAKRVLAGKKGGAAKSLKTKDTGPSNAKAMPKQPEPEPEPYKRDTNVSLVGSDQSEISDAVSRFNRAAETAGWPKVQKLSQPRSKHLKARLAECGGISGWEVALKKAIESDFLRGRTAKAWTGFGFDWLVNASNFTKIMEGNYDNRSGNPGHQRSGTGRSGDNFFDALSQVAAERSGRA